MSRGDKAREIGARFGLTLNMFERDRPGEFEVGIVDYAGGYTVYWSTERTWVVYSEQFADETAALDKVIGLLLLENERRELFATHPRPRSPTLE